MCVRGGSKSGGFREAGAFRVGKKHTPKVGGISETILEGEVRVYLRTLPEHAQVGKLAEAAALGDLVTLRAALLTPPVLLTVRVELLHAEALPLHLLDSLKSVFESNDSLVRKAAESHREQLGKHLEFVRSLDYSALTEELNYWMELFNNRLRDRLRLDPKKYFSLANQIEGFEGAYVLLNARLFSLAAIGLFASGSSRNEAVSFLDGQSWSTKHEVLTRWGWIKRHNELLKDGIKLAAPYSCSLVPKGATYEQDDEEFYQGQPFGGGPPLIPATCG